MSASPTRINNIFFQFFINLLRTTVRLTRRGNQPLPKPNQP
jgi:hypothetical protein